MKLLRSALLFTLVLLCLHVNAVTYYTRATGNWNAATTWSTVGCGGAAAAATPTAGDIVFICATHTVSVTANVTTMNVTINNGGYLLTGTTAGGANKTVTITGNFTILAGGTYEHNNNQAASTTIFAGAEFFDPASTIIITNWSADTDRLITGVSSNFGNVTLNWNPGAFIWQNDGLGYTRTIQGNFTVGLGCSTILDQSTANIVVPIGGNLTVTGTLRIKYFVNGNLTLTVGGTTSVSGTLHMIYSGNGVLTYSSSNVNISAGQCWGIYAGDGNCNWTIPGTFTMSGGDCRGINNTSTFTAGIINFQIGTFNFTNGTFLASYACHVGGQTSVFNVTGNMTVNYAAATALCAISRLATLAATPTTNALNFTVGGTFTISGLNGEFNSNNGTGAETNTFTGAVSISNGNNFFNSVLTAGNGHTTTTTMSSTLNVSGGNTRLSSESGTLTANINGNATISGGTLSAKEGNGTATVNFNADYSQTGGSFFLHNSTTTTATNVVTTNVYGAFSQTGGVINFDNNTASTATHVLNIYGASYTIATGSMTHANPGTGTVFGELHFARTGTTTFARTNTTHSIQQVKQFVDAPCTVDAVASASPLQIASHATQATIANTALTINGILDMGSVAITAVGPSLTGYYSGLTNNGRLRLTRTNGMYDGATTGTIQPQVFATDATFRMDWFLAATSYVEYYGTANIAVTGKYPVVGSAVADVTSAVAAQYHYGYLDINITGVGVAAFPHLPIAGTGNVFVRTSLLCTAGELNLAGSGTGQTITIENSAATGITRNGTTTVGWIKSEEVNGGNNRAKVRWNTAGTTGARIIPFGVATGAANFIPFTFNKTSAGAADVLVSTRATATSSNTPWAAASNVGAVAHMYDPTLGQDGSDEAVIDRWWDITTTAACTATVTFSYRGIENTMIAPYQTGTIGAQHWDGTAWEPPVGSAVAVTAGVGSLTVAGLNTFSPWILSSLAAPLPVELVSAGVTCVNGYAVLEWATASETMNDYFSIEKSLDGQNFVEVGRVEGNNTTTEMHYYSFTDPQALQSWAYYRIRQVDYNGTSNRTSVFAVEPCSVGGSVVNSWYSQGNIHVEIIGEQEGDYSIDVMDLQGRVVKSSSVSKNGGVIHNENPTGELAEGIYVVRVTDSNGVVNTSRICICN